MAIKIGTTLDFGLYIFRTFTIRPSDLVTNMHKLQTPAKATTITKTMTIKATIKK